MSHQDIYYWAARAAEERRIAASLPEGSAASVHRKLADLYDQAVRREANGYQARKATEATDRLEFAGTIKSAE